MAKRLVDVPKTLDHRRLKAEILAAMGPEQKPDDLIQEAGISPKTVDKIVAEHPPFTGLRSDVVLRLAKSLRRSPQQTRLWLAWAGHPNFSVGKITEFLQADVTESAGKEAEVLEPTAYFDELSQALDEKWEVMMCVCMLSKPAPIDDPG